MHATFFKTKKKGGKKEKGKEKKRKEKLLIQTMSHLNKPIKKLTQSFRKEEEHDRH